MARLKKPLNIYIDADLLDRLDRWLREQCVPPPRTLAVETALKEFIDSNSKRGGSPSGPKPSKK